MLPGDFTVSEGHGHSLVYSKFVGVDDVDYYQLV
jgi:hypothetical protein